MKTLILVLLSGMAWAQTTTCYPAGTGFQCTTLQPMQTPQSNGGQTITPQRSTYTPAPLYLPQIQPQMLSPDEQGARSVAKYCKKHPGKPWHFQYPYYGIDKRGMCPERGKK